MNLLIVIPFTAHDAPLAERLCDWIFEQAGRKPRGHCLLVSAADVHQEMAVKVQIAAEVAFETAEMIVAPEPGSVVLSEIANQLFKFAGDYIIRHYRSPWLLLDPAAVPLRQSWREQLAQAYESQPKRYLGGHLQFEPAVKDQPAKLCLARCSVYPANAIGDLAAHCTGSAPFQIAGAQTTLSRSTKSRLVQEWVYDGDPTKLRPDAVVLNSDKSGRLIEHLRSQLAVEPVVNIPITADKPKMTVEERMAKARAARGKVGAIQTARL
jgi:hypothetical protein